MKNDCDIFPGVNYKDLQSYFSRCIPAYITNRDIFDAVFDEMRVQSQLHLSNSVLGILIAIYVTLMLFGACGSTLVIYAVVHGRSMRSPRNIFIVNLAISDLILCVLTEPFNLIRLLSGQQEWILGDSMCKLSALLQGTNIFVSTISITAIALDRFQVIVHPTITSMDRKAAVKMLAVIWILSIFLASPLIVFSKIKHEGHIQCTEKSQNFAILLSKLIYSMLSAVVQYLVPLIIVIIVYTRICIRIRSRMNLTREPELNVERHISQGCQNQFDDTACQLFSFKRSKRIQEEQRKRRTNILLASIAMIFALSWLPLVSFNILMDIREMRFFMTSTFTSNSLFNLSTNLMSNMLNNSHTEEKLFERNISLQKPDINGVLQGQTVFLIQASCLLAVLSSACINPILYGWLNENFRNEFKLIFRIKTVPNHETKISMISRDLNAYSKLNNNKNL
uniref:NPYR-6 n=1 Tax=Schmidtea mediterranea TaxID=79327 RepID=A0A193KUU3_SCHMD|nr:NPYR-6 [Schmidtea mediterranea]